LYSDTFSLKDMPEAIFQVIVSGSSSSIYLCCKKIGQNGKLKLSVKLSVKFWIESGGKKFNELVKQYVFGKLPVGFHCLADFNCLTKFIVGDSLTIFLKMKLEVSTFDEEPELDEVEADEVEADVTKTGAFQQFLQNLGNLHSEGHSDLTIQAGGKEFKALKHVLMSRSEIFKAMFSCPNSTEAQTGILKIENIRAEVIEVLISWTHTFKVNNLDEIAEDLFRAAHKYQIELLMKICAQSIAKSLTLENMTPRIILAYTYDVEDLKKFIVNSVKKDQGNLHKLMTSQGWFDFTAENQELAVKILDDILK